MVSDKDSTCPKCKGYLRPYGHAKRIVRTKGRQSKWITIARLRCEKCGMVHRALPDDILPYKQYEKEVILGVLEGFITPETYGFEDYPCESTMIFWTHNLQGLLWSNSSCIYANRKE